MDALYTAVATANGREGRAVSSDGQIDLALALPPALGGNGEGTNPEQLFAAGYAACFASAMGLVGRADEGRHQDVSVTAEVSIGKDDTGFGLAVVMRVELPEALEGETGRGWSRRRTPYCPYSKATRGNIDGRARHRVVGPESPTPAPGVGDSSWQGRQESNLRHPVLETGALASELHPFGGSSASQPRRAADNRISWWIRARFPVRPAAVRRGPRTLGSRFR